MLKKFKITSNYSQPDFYKFSRDSIELVDFSVNYIKERGSSQTLLDLCCGCGVIGIEAFEKVNGVEKVSFLELQTEFFPHLKKNIEESSISDFKLYETPLGKQAFTERFDLIYSNPPYFIPGEGRVSENELRQNCRTFEVDGWNVFLKKVHEWLDADGFFFLSTRSLKLLEESNEFFKIEGKEKFGETWLVCLTRLNKNRS